MGKILITGITGNVGMFIYRHLPDLRESIVGAVTSVPGSRQRFKDIKLVEFDFLDRNTYDKALEDVDRVFLMRPPHLGRPQDLYSFIDALAERKIKLVVFLSLMGAAKNPFPPHHKIEKYIKRSGLPYCHIRPGFFMQNLSGIHAAEIKEKGEIFIPAGKSKCSFIDVKDLGHVISSILREHERHRNTAYTITGRESLDYCRAAGILSEVLQRNITYTNPSWIKFRRYMIKERGLEKGMVNVMLLLYFMTRLGTASAVHNDFEAITGRKPGTFRQFAEENSEVWSDKITALWAVPSCRRRNPEARSQEPE